MIGYVTLILFCQLIGETIVNMTKAPIPGPLIGMLLLFCGLVLHGKIPSELETVGRFLHRYLPVLFVPAGVGIIVHLDLLRTSWAPFAGAIVVGTVITIAVSAGAMQFLNRRHFTAQKGPQQ